MQMGWPPGKHSSSSSKHKYRNKDISYAGVAGKESGYVGGSRNAAAAAAAAGGGGAGYGKQVRRESYNPNLDADQVQRNKEEGRCFACHKQVLDENGKFDRNHISNCPARKRKADVSDGC